MKKIWLHLVSVVFVFVFILGGWDTSQSAAYPEREITILVPWPAGGGGDSGARLLAPALSRKLGQTVSVENVPGASGVLGVTRYVNSKPDGYKILFNTPGAHTSQMFLQKLTYDTLTDLVPIGSLFVQEVYLVARASDPYSNLKEMEAYWRKAGKDVKMASAGLASVGDCMNRLLADQMKIKALHIPFTNLAESATAVMGGHADVGIVTGPEATPAVAEGRLKILALLGSHRSAYFPNSPTSKEQGYSVDLMSWMATFVQKNVPGPIVQKLVDVVKEVVKDPDLANSAAKSRTAILYMSPDELTADLKRQQQLYGEVLSSIGLLKK
jgi:tripartite-type tricarboxylate transporter receptor subunit TctC